MAHAVIRPWIRPILTPLQVIQMMIEHSLFPRGIQLERGSQYQLDATQQIGISNSFKTIHCFIDYFYKNKEIWCVTLLPCIKVEEYLITV